MALWRCFYKRRGGGFQRIVRTFSQEVLTRDSYSELCHGLEASPETSLELIDAWRAKPGNRLTVGKVSEIFEKLAERKERRAALKFLAHVKKNNIVELTTNLCIRELEVASFEYGPRGMRRSYEELPESMKTDQVTAALVLNLVRSRDLNKALKWAKDLPTEPKTPDVWHALISLYFAKDMHEHVVAAFERLRMSGVEPYPETYLLMLKCKERIGGLEGVEEEAKAAVEKLNVRDTNMDRVLVSCMAEVYAYLGEAGKVDELWNVLKATPEILPLDCYRSVLNAYGVLGQAEKAEEVFNMALEHRKSRTNHYFDLMEVYGRLGLVDKAKQLLDTEKIKEKYLCNALVVHHLKENEVDKALELVKVEFSETFNYASYEALVGLLPALAAKKDVKTARQLVRHYLFSRHGDVRVYNGLLEVYVATGTKPDRLLTEEFLDLVPNDRTILLLLECHYL